MTALGTKSHNCVYFMRAASVGLIKIGVSNNVERRLYTLNLQSPVEIKLSGSVIGGQMEERAIHRRFSNLRHHGEWFRESPELLLFVSQAETCRFGLLGIAIRSQNSKMQGRSHLWSNARFKLLGDFSLAEAKETVEWLRWIHNEKAAGQELSNMREIHDARVRFERFCDWFETAFGTTVGRTLAEPKKLTRRQHSAIVRKTQRKMFARQSGGGLVFDGRKMSISAWAREIGISRQALNLRLRRHPLEIALRPGRMQTRKQEI